MIEAAHQRLAALMAEEGLPFAPASRIPNTRRAQELAAWGIAQGNHRLGDALYRAHFAEGRNIGDNETLVAIAAEVGLDASQAAEVLAARSRSAQIDGEWQRARSLGVTGVPTFVIGRQGVVGAQPFETLERFALACGATPR